MRYTTMLVKVLTTLMNLHRLKEVLLSGRIDDQLLGCARVDVYEIGELNAQCR